MIETLKENLLLKNKFAAIYNDEVKFPSGIVGTHFRVESTGDGGVLIIPVMEDGKVTMIHNFRYAAGAPVLEFPMGGIGQNEMSTDAAKRELLEEVSLEFDSLTFAGKIIVAPSICSGDVNVFIAWGCKPTTLQIDVDPLEDIVEQRVLTFAEASKLLFGDRMLVDSASISAFGFVTNALEKRMLNYCAEQGSAFLMGAYCGAKGMSFHANPYRNANAQTHQYLEWDRGWRYFFDQF